MVQIVEQTREEKLAMYMKLSKKELAEMLINCNDLFKLYLPQVQTPINQGFAHYYPPFCQHEMEYVQSTGGGFYQCKKCGYTPQTFPATHYFQS